jgi:hypothetical protein
MLRAMQRIDRRLTLLIVTGIVGLALAIPVLAASPTPGESDPPGQAAKEDRGPETPVSLTGTIRESADSEGRPSYSMTVDGKTWTVSAGPSWFWGDKNPLAPFVGTSVRVTGTTRGSEAEVDVTTVDGKALREPGKPPWAGGPWVVGETHPGWKGWKADGKPGNGHGPNAAPGQLKKESATP